MQQVFAQEYGRLMREKKLNRHDSACVEVLGASGGNVQYP